jgi:DNA-binding CsgD family transcriptional regulator
LEESRETKVNFMEIMAQLSEKEKMVIDLLMLGKSNKQIALLLGITNRTVEFHLTNIYQKMGVNSRSEAILALTHKIEEPLRESTVANPSKNRQDTDKTLPAKGRNMNKKWFLLLGILVVGSAVVGIALLALLMPFPDDKTKNNTLDLEIANLTQIPAPSAIPLNTFTPAISAVPILTTTDEYTFVQTINGQVIRLTVNWFYIDQERIDLNYTICDPAFPVDDAPVSIAHFIDVKITSPDGHLLPIKVDYSGGGGSPQTDPVDAKHACFRETIDFTIIQPVEYSSLSGLYQVDLPVGGEVRTDSDRIITTNMATFHLSIKPTFSGMLTFRANITEPFNDKQVVFKGILADPTAMRSIICVTASDGYQWMPVSNLVYQGNVIISEGFSVISGDPSTEMCYNIIYRGDFKISSSEQVKKNITVLLTKLVKDTPEIISTEQIVIASEKLAAEGIIFEYITAPNGARIVIKQMPAGLSETDAIIKVQQAISQDVLPSHVVEFTLH